MAIISLTFNSKKFKCRKNYWIELIFEKKIIIKLTASMWCMTLNRRRLTCTVILIPKFNNCTLFFLSGTLTVEEVYKDRDQFASLVREVAAPDVGRMGIEILSFTIKDVYDNVTYLASLGKNHRHLRIRMIHKTYNRCNGRNWLRWRNAVMCYALSYDFPIHSRLLILLTKNIVFLNRWRVTLVEWSSF